MVQVQVHGKDRGGVQCEGGAQVLLKVEARVKAGWALPLAAGEPDWLEQLSDGSRRSTGLGICTLERQGLGEWQELGHPPIGRLVAAN